LNGALQRMDYKIMECDVAWVAFHDPYFDLRKK